MKRLLLLPLLILTAAVCGAEGLAVLKATAPEEVPFARSFTAQVVLSHPRGETVEINKDSVPAEFELQAARLEPVGVDTTQADLIVLPFTLNKSTFTVSFSLAGQPDSTVQAEVPLTVKPVKLFDDNELREIRPPHRMFDWATWLSILLALAALICLLIFWWRRAHREDSPQLAAPPDNRPPHVIALSQIDALINSGLWENKQYKVFYITLSDILRTYLQRAFGLDVSADTSAELLRRLKTVPALTPLLTQVRQFVTSGDLVKFAKFIPTEETRNRDITLLREVIEKTAPRPPKPTVREEVSL